MLASKIIATVILVILAIFSFFKNNKVYEEEVPTLIFTVVDLALLVFVGVVLWGVI